MAIDPNDCINHFCSQVGGGGNYFHSPIVHQRGYGLFQDVTRYLSPIFLRAGKYIGKQLLSTGSKVLTDVVQGKPFKISAKNRLKETGHNIKNDLIEKLQKGSGIKRKNSKVLNHFSSSKRKRKQAQDIFTKLQNGKRKVCTHKK